MDHVINSYTMIAVCPLLYLAWKVLKRSKFYKPEEVDLVKNLDEIEAYEANYMPRPAKYVAPLPYVKLKPLQYTDTCFIGVPSRGRWISSSDSN